MTPERFRREFNRPVPVPVPVPVFSLREKVWVCGFHGLLTVKNPRSKHVDNPMNWIETEAFLRARRALTREVYTDETITAWSQALAAWEFEDCHKALIEASRGSDRVFVAQIVKHLAPRPATGPTRDAHSIACICGGRGWLEVEQQDDNGTWMAWARCPNGPPTGFIEP